MGVGKNSSCPTFSHSGHQGEQRSLLAAENVQVASFFLGRQRKTQIRQGGGRGGAGIWGQVFMGHCKAYWHPDPGALLHCFMQRGRDEVSQE